VTSDKTEITCTNTAQNAMPAANSTQLYIVTLSDVKVQNMDIANFKSISWCALWRVFRTPCCMQISTHAILSAPVRDFHTATSFQPSLPETKTMMP